MADEKEDTEAKEEGGGKSKLLMVIVISNMLIMVLAGAAVFFAMNNSGEAEDSDGGDEESHVMGPLVELPSMVVNLDEEETGHFLRAGFQAEVESEETLPELQSRMVPIRSAFMLHLSGLHIEDTQGREKREQLLEQLRDLCNEIAGDEDLVRRVYFTEFVVQ